MDEPAFLSREKVLELHRISLQLHGGLETACASPGLLDSALNQPEAVYFYGLGDLAAIAAAYAFHIAQNQPFIDGNKMASALTFLEGNGIDIDQYDGTQLYEAMIAIAEKRLDKAGLAGVFRQHIPG